MHLIHPPRGDAENVVPPPQSTAVECIPPPPPPDPVAVRMPDALKDQLIDIFMGEKVPERTEEWDNLFTKPTAIILGPRGVEGEVRTYRSFRLVKWALASRTPLVQVREKLPWRIYAQLVALAKEVHKEHNAEVVTYLWKHREGEDRFEIMVPQQQVSGGSAQVDDRDLQPPDDSGLWDLWGHAHSHNTMNAFFSGTDDSSETQDGLFYMVVGNVPSPTPEVKVRLRALGGFFTLAPDAVISDMPIWPKPNETLRQRMSGIVSRVTGGRVMGPREDYRAPARTNFSNTAYVLQVIRKDGRVYNRWSDGALAWTGKRVEDLSTKERVACLVEGIDWPNTTRES